MSRLNDLLSEIKLSPEESLLKFLSNKEEDTFRNIEEELTALALYADFTNVLTDTGVVTEQNLFREFLYRANRKFFPPVYPDKEFRSILRELDERFSFTETILKLSPATFALFLEKVFSVNIITEESLRRKLHSPIKILITRLIFHCTSRQFFDRLSNAPNLKEQILDTDKAAYQFLDNPNAGTLASLEGYLQTCDVACEHIRDNRNTEGISLEVTYRIMAIHDHVARVKALAKLLVKSGDRNENILVADLIQTILSLEADSNKIGKLIWDYVGLVSYEITEHTGRKGEDYIKRDRQGTRKMLQKGLIGGAIVGMLAFLKPLLGELNLAPFIEALGFSFIYSSIFLVIYFVGGVLATKQPAMTASRLAHELDKSQPSDRFLWEVAGLIRDTFRSQFLAIFGNFALALPVAALVTWTLQKTGMHSFLPDTERYLITSLHPFLSLSVLYAAITGVCLAVSGIAAGAMRNWFIFNRIDVRLKENILAVTLVGKERVADVTEFANRHLEGIAGNLTLGFLLGFLSTLGSVLGLPIDIRHITFASAQVGTVMGSSIEQYSWVFLLFVVLGVILIGVINLVVSFSITFIIAFKSRNLSFDQGRRLIQICISRFLREPSKFIFRAE